MKRLLPLFLLAACAQAPEPPGRALARATGCFSCHRVGAYGGASGPDLSFVGFRRSPLWLERWLAGPRGWKHDALMPDFHLTEESRAVFVDWLSSLQGQDLPAGQRPWDGMTDPIEKGRTIYTKAGCLACHGLDGRGGEPNNNVPGLQIVALSKVVPTYTREELTKRIAHGMKATRLTSAAPDPLVDMPAWKKVLNETEIDAVAQYLESVGEPAPEWR